MAAERGSMDGARGSDDAAVDDELDPLDEPEIASVPGASRESRTAAPVGIGIENVVGLILGSPEFQRR
jgi:hypothetical protein